MITRVSYRPLKNAEKSKENSHYNYKMYTFMFFIIKKPTEVLTISPSILVMISNGNIELELSVLQSD